MKVVSRSNQRINIFWNYASDKVTINEQNDIKIIAEYREKLLLMVKQGKLTKDEYDKFRKSIGKMNIGKFVDCIFISNLIFDIPRCELLNEIKNLSNNGFLVINLECHDEIAQIFYLISEIQHKLLSVASSLTRQNESDDIDYLENLLASFNIEDKQYLEMLDEFYAEWVEKTFSIESIKSVMLNNKSLFKREVQKYAIMALNKAYASNNIPNIYERERHFNFLNKKLSNNK